jgi:virginiamycin B lyase
MTRRRALVGAAVLGTLALAGSAHAVTITEFPVEPGAAAGAHQPSFVRSGPDGALWFADRGTSPGIGRMSTAGERIAPIPALSAPQDIAVGPDGRVHWTEGSVRFATRAATGALSYLAAGGASYAAGVDGIGRPWFTTEFLMGTTAVCRQADMGTALYCQQSGSTSRFTSLTLGPDGKFWIAGFEEDRIRRFSPPFATPYELAIPVPGARPARIVVGPDRNLWVTMYGASAIERVTPDGVTTRFPLPPGRGPNDIAVGPDGALWFTEFDGRAIGRMTVQGVLTDEFAVPAGSVPYGITTGSDGAVWYTSSSNGRLGRVLLDAPGTPGGRPGGGSGGVVDDARPTFVRGMAVTSARFRATRGTIFTFTLSEPARVTITIARARTGRRVGGVCRRRTAANRGRPACRRWVTAGQLSRAGLQGPNRMTFSGRLRGRRLPAGSYRARAVARDPAGNVSRASAVQFTVIR